MEKGNENIDWYDDLLNFLYTKCKLVTYFMFLLHYSSHTVLVCLLFTLSMHFYARV